MIENTPYQYNPEWYEILDSNRHSVATGVDLKRADFIIKAVNNHDRLVEALKETSAILHLLTRVSIPDHFMDEALNVAKEAKKLLTELKTQS